MIMKENGFTLLEVLIATVIIGVGVAVLIGLFGNVLAASGDAENTLIAMNLCQQRMEEIRNLAFAGIADESKADVSGFSGFQREVEVDPPDVDPDMSDLKQVTVTVYWTFNGDEISVPLETYISKN